MKLVQRDEIDGVPVFIGELPGDALGAIVFRVGHADETLITRGITHLVEHLSLFPLDRKKLEWNGVVDLSYTLMHCRGTPEEVGSGLTALARSLAALPLDRMERETQVLRAEAAQRRPSTLGSVLYQRWGATSAGLLDYEEMFLLQPDAAVLDDWRRRYFTRGNCAIVLSCPVPTTLDVSALPDGPSRPLGQGTAVAMHLPGYFHTNSASVGLSVTMPRDILGTAMLDILRSVMHDALRDELGLSYSVQVHSQPLQPGAVHHLLNADCLVENAPAVLSRMLFELHRLRYDGIPSSVIDDYRSERDRGYRQPSAGFGAAVMCANEWIATGSELDTDTLDETVTALRSEDLMSNLRRVIDTAVWSLPNGVQVSDARLRPIPGWSTTLTDGRKFPCIVPSGSGRWIAVSKEGVSLAVPDQGWVTVMYDDVAAYKMWSDGARTIFGTDGFSITVHPSDWHDTKTMISMMDEAVPDGLVVRTPDPLRKS